MEVERWIVQKTLTNLEATYDMTNLQIEEFYILVRLDHMTDLMGIPKLFFKYNGTLHIRGLEERKTVISFSDKNNLNSTSLALDIGNWNTFILENVALLSETDNKILLNISSTSPKL